MKPKTVKTSQTELDGQNVSYTLKRSTQAKMARLQISAKDGLVVTIPRSYKIADVLPLLQQKKSWILKHLARFKAAPPLKPADQSTSLPKEIFYLGKAYPLSVEIASVARPKVALLADRLQVTVANESAVIPAIHAWLLQTAKPELTRRTAELAARMQLAYAALTVKLMKSRWGSCSSKKRINLNARLLMAPPDVIDYVIIHELSHLKELNHSPAFWALVANFCPDYKLKRRWLKQNTSNWL